MAENRYYIRFDPEQSPATGYTLWDDEKGILVSEKMNQTEAREAHRRLNKREQSDG